MPSLRGIPGLASQAAGSHEQLLALINNMSDGFVALDNLGNITLSNSVALSTLDTNSVTGRKLSEAIDIIDKNGYPIDLQKMILLSDGSFTNRDWRLRYKDSSTINLQISASPVRTGFGQKSQGGYVVLMRDITREKSLEEERDEFISVASHELRTPVAVAEGSISNARLLAERANASDTIKHSLAAAYEQVMFLSNLINDLAMLSRADRGKAAQTVETFAAGELVESLVHDYQPEAAKKKLSLQPRIPQELGLITNSRLYVREILQNFITNSIKYTQKGGITLSAEPKDDGVEFSVADTGIGIGKSEQGKLFSKFFRSQDWRVRENSGTGLGLYVTAKLARLLGAKIEMQSELNRGSTFRLLVPNVQKPPEH